MTRYTIDDLIQVMACLRDPKDGCPWDLQQSYRDIVPFTLEEAYEVADAIERGAYEELPGELGDLLFQVVFYARLGEEDARFDFAEIVHQLVDKLLTRHPHVFPDATLSSFGTATGVSMRDIKSRWEEKKADERAARGQLGLFDDVPKALPALSRAQKIQKRARAIGFDWVQIEGVLDKVSEELTELHEARTQNDPKQVLAEFGDLLFTIVSLGRHLGVDSEQALRLATLKFQQRLNTVQHLALQQSLQVSEVDDAVRERLWQLAKDQLSEQP